jgi:hypothetical protein
MTRNLSADRAFVRDRAKAMRASIDALYGATIVLQSAADRSLSVDMVATTERALEELGTRLRDMQRGYEHLVGIVAFLRCAVDEEVAEARAGGP